MAQYRSRASRKHKNFMPILETLCNKPTAPIIVNSNKITVSFVTGSDFAAGQRGAGFNLVYSTNGVSGMSFLICMLSFVMKKISKDITDNVKWVQ